MEIQAILQSETLLLRAPELSDLDFMFHIENDTRLWHVSACKVPYSRYLLQQYIENNTHDIYTDKQVRLMIEHRPSGEVVGTIDLFDFSPADRRAEVGIIIDDIHRGRGYAREALSLLCDYAEHTLGLHQVYAYIYEDNNAARQLFTHGGFTHTATLPDWVLTNKKYKSVGLFQRIFENNY